MKRLYITLILILGIILLNSCKNSYENIFSDLNGKCGTIEDKTKVSSVTDTDYSENQMLSEEIYTVANDSFFMLNGPEGGVSYLWTLSVPKIGKMPAKTVDISDKAVLEYEMPGEFVEGAENILQLVVTTSDGKKFIDKAKILLISR